ncbi:deacylase, partial [Rhizobium leguminosarum]
FEIMIPSGKLAGGNGGAEGDGRLERLEQPEEELRFAESGIVISQRLNCDSQAGDCLIQVAEPIAS